MGNEQEMAAAKQSLKDKLMAIILIETSKDYREMDSDLVTECVDFLMELEGKQRLSKKEIEQRVKAIPFKGKVTAINSYAKKKIRAKRLAVIAAILAVIIALFGVIAVGSGDLDGEILRKLEKYFSGLPTGSVYKYDDSITFYKSSESKTYSSIEELAKSEGIEILYPGWLPENEKIVAIIYDKYIKSESCVLQFNIPEHSIVIFPGIGLTEEIKSSCIKKEIAGITVFYLKTPDFIQANFIYKNNLYTVKADTEDNLFKIIENLKEIN